MPFIEFELRLTEIKFQIDFLEVFIYEYLTNIYNLIKLQYNETLQYH